MGEGWTCWYCKHENPPDVVICEGDHEVWVYGEFCRQRATSDIRWAYEERFPNEGQPYHLHVALRRLLALLP